MEREGGRDKWRWMDGRKESGGQVDKEKQGVMACDDGARFFQLSPALHSPLSQSDSSPPPTPPGKLDCMPPSTPSLKAPRESTP